MTAPMPDELEQRARQAADGLQRASALRAPELSDVVTLARLGRAAWAAAGLAVLVFLTAAVFALSSVVGPAALVWAGVAVLATLMAATLVVSAHAGGHAWFVPLPGAVFTVMWFVAVVGGHRSAASWWLLAAGAAFSGVAVIVAVGVLRARVTGRRISVASLVGAEAVVVHPLELVGIVRLRGETWTAESLSGPLAVGTTVHVVRAQGLRLLVWSEAGDVPGVESLMGSGS
jgi:membrane protein implicated in regulation of membrane protease activity